MVTLSIRMSMLAFAVMASCIGSGSSVYVLVQHYANENCTDGEGAVVMEEAISPDAHVTHLLGLKSVHGCQQINGDQLQEVLGGPAVKFVTDEKDGSCKLTVFSDETCGAAAANRSLFQGTCKKTSSTYHGHGHAAVKPYVSAPVAARPMAPQKRGGVASTAAGAADLAAPPAPAPVPSVTENSYKAPQNRGGVASTAAEAADVAAPAPVPSVPENSHKDDMHAHHGHDHEHKHNHDEHYKEKRRWYEPVAAVVHQCKSGPVPEGVWDATCMNATLQQDVFAYFYSRRMFREGEDKVECLRSCIAELNEATSKKAFDALFSDGGCAASCSAEVKAIARQKQVQDKTSDCQFRAKKKQVVEQPVPEIMV